jgi:site-specific DNA recombinase
VTGNRQDVAEISDQGPARALSYLRVSTKEQASKGGEVEGYSIPAQRDACVRKAETLSAAVIEEFVDAGESARSAKRPELQRMLRYITENQVDYLIVHKIDRLARNRADDVEISLALKAAGVTLVSCTENIDETPSGALMHGIMSSIAEFYSRNLAHEVIKGLSKKVETGGTIGRPPPGYLNITYRINGREVRSVEVDEERVEHVRWAFGTFAIGDVTLIQLTEQLEARGMTIAPGPNTPARVMSRSTVQRMLRNAYYIGLVNWRGAQHEGNHDAVIDRDVWYRVQAVLDSHRFGEKQRKNPHYLKGSIFCGGCGSRLCFDRKTNRYGTTYEYFFCVGRHQKRTDCVRGYVPVEAIEDQVENKWRNLRLHREYAELLGTILEQDLAHYHESTEHSRRSAKRRLQTLEGQRQKLLAAYYADSMPMDLFKTEQARLTTEIRRTEAKLQAVEISYAQVKKTLEKCLQFATDCDRSYRESPPTLRRQLNQAVFRKFIVDEDGILKADLAEPFDRLLSPNLLEEKEQDEESMVTARLEEVDIEESPRHHNDEWADGVPAWLRDSQWWNQKQDRPHGYAVTGRNHRSVGRRRIVSLCLGSKENDLAEGVGFEPTEGCPSHAFQACRFGRSRIPPGKRRSYLYAECLRRRVTTRSAPPRWLARSVTGPARRDPVNRVRSGRKQLSAGPPGCRRVA